MKNSLKSSFYLINIKRFSTLNNNNVVNFNSSFFIEYLKNRNSFFQTTNENFKYNYNDKVYIGFDPTSDKLHIGNMFGIINAIRSIAFGFQPLFLIGGATALIGDPSGKNKERAQLPINIAHENSKSIELNIRSILEKIVKSNQFMNYIKENGINEDIKNSKYDDKNFEIVNNSDTYSEMNVINFMREVVSNYRVSSLLSKESAKSRLNSDEGMSVVEFMYPIFQGYDYYNLFNKKNVKMQIGGSDQWGNMISGLELIHKMQNIDGNKNKKREDLVLNLTFPLITTKSGKKLGKSEGNSINICENSSKFMYQYLLNQSDEDVENFLLKLTLLSNKEIKNILVEHEKNKESRLAQRILAENFISLYCSEEKVKESIYFSNNYFKNELTLEYFENSAKIILNYSEFNQISILQFCINNKLSNKKSELRILMSQENFMLNNNPIFQDRKLSDNDLLFDKYFVLRLSKNKKYLFKINK